MCITLRDSRHPVKSSGCDARHILRVQEVSPALLLHLRDPVALRRTFRVRRHVQEVVARSILSQTVRYVLDSHALDTGSKFLLLCVETAHEVLSARKLRLGSLDQLGSLCVL